MLKKIIGLIWRKLTPTLRRKIVRITQDEFTASVAAIIINENNEVLLLDHVLRPNSNWGIPGGFLNRGEQPEDAVRRELREETGIELNDVKLFQIKTTNQHIEILFRAEPVGVASVKSREINAVGWFKSGELPENMNRIQKSAIEEFLRS